MPAGGPAGAAYLAEAGYAVALLDQKTFLRDKVCGDFVGPAAIAELDYLGVTDRPEFWHTNEIRQAVLYLDGEELIARDFPRADGLPDYGRVIPRIDLDHWIVQAAVGAGAELLERAPPVMVAIWPIRRQRPGAAGSPAARSRGATAGSTTRRCCSRG